MRPAHGLNSMPVRQSHVQQENIHSTFRKVTLSFMHTHDVLQFETIRLLLTKHLAQQASVSRVILNQKNLKRMFLHERASRGNLTIDSQKRSMLLTTLRNPSRSTGFVI